jgi:hypothetical protein
MEAWRLHALEICIPVVADSHNFDEEQDPDPQ